jgi:hypothetical protein
MGPDSEPKNATPYSRAEGDAVIAAANLDSAESAWERIATAREIVAEHAGCSPDEALRALKDRAEVLGDPIGTLADGVIDGETFKVHHD